MEMYKFYWNWRGCWLAFEQGLVGWLNKNVLCSTQPQLRIALLFSCSMITIYPCSQYFQTCVNTTHSFRQTVNRKLWRLASGYIFSLPCPVFTGGWVEHLGQKATGQEQGQSFSLTQYFTKSCKVHDPSWPADGLRIQNWENWVFSCVLPGGSWKESLHWLPKNRDMFLKAIKKKKKETKWNIFVLRWKDRKPYHTS